MPDLLIRDVPVETIVELDKKALALGISRTDFLLRTLNRQAQVGLGPVVETDLSTVLELLPDLADQALMRGAWK